MSFNLAEFDESGKPPTTPLPTARGQLNFVANTYTFDAVSYTLGQTTTQTGWRTANGLEVPDTTSVFGTAILISPLNTFLATCLFTAVYSVDILSLGYSIILSITNTGGAFFIENSFDGTEWYSSAFDGNLTAFASEGTHSISTGIHTFGVTRSSSTHLVVSVDGFPVQIDTTFNDLPVGGFPMTVFNFGGYVNSGAPAAFRLRTASFYDVVSDADLQRLTV